MMKHMKIYKLLIALPLLAGLQACSGWLDLEPKDTTTETDLFQTGDGYRIALNGVYQQMSETGLYGKELSWGFLDVLAQMYTSYLLTNITEYRYAVSHDCAAGFTLCRQPANSDRHRADQPSGRSRSATRIDLGFNHRRHLHCLWPLDVETVAGFHQQARQRNYRRYQGNSQPQLRTAVEPRKQGV